MSSVSATSGTGTGVPSLYTGSNNGTNAAAKAAATAKDPSEIDQNTFLKLLVAQLKYQDPSKPTDPSQFLSQTAQFTQVEKLGALATATQQVIDATRGQSAISLVGKSVTYTDASGTSRSGMVTAATLGSTTPNLTIGGLPVSLDAITSVTSGTTS